MLRHMATILTADTPPPAPRIYARRLTKEIRRLVIGQVLIADPLTVRAARAYFRRNGQRSVVERQPDGLLKLWLIA